MKKRLLFITTRLFWPTDSGRKVSLYYYCKGLSEQYGYDVYIYSFLEGGQTPDMLADKPDFLKEVRLAKHVNILGKSWNMLTRGLFGGWPFQTTLFYSGANRRAIRAYCEEIRPDAVIVDMVRLAPYYNCFRELPCRKILDLDDLLSRRYVRQSRRSDTGSDLLGASADRMSRTSNRILRNSFVKRMILRSESRRCHRAEKKYGRLYDSAIFVSEAETAAFNRMIGEDKAYTVTLGVDFAFYRGAAGMDKEPGAVAFLGNLKYAPNQDSLSLIAERVLPRMKQPYTLYVVGTVPEGYEAQFAENPHIVFSGRVDDLRQTIGKCNVFLSPIAYGSGIKTKILEALAMGLPVVTNTIGAEGLSVTDGENILIRVNAETMAEAVDDLLTDGEKCRRIGAAGQAYIADKHTWDIVWRKFADMGL